MSAKIRRCAMNNKGQTTVLFSLIISVLFLFTLSALEAGRIYMSKVKIRAVVHSTQSSIMADYNRELFERYHLLFMDPTYGTGSEAAAEEKIEDYLETSLNSGEGNIYRFTVEEIGLANQKNIFKENMKQLKEQITEYEKTAGLLQKAKDLGNRFKEGESGIEKAAKETERNGTALPDTGGEPMGGEKDVPEKNGDNKEQGKGEAQVKADDPRDALGKTLKTGILAFVLPDDRSVSKEKYDFSDAPSEQYQEQKEEEKDNSFRDIEFLKGFLKKSGDTAGNNIETYAAFVSYADSHFSNMVNPMEESVLKCEEEYILKGKNSDYDNLESVVNELIWIRMPVNYAYLLTDEQKKSEALTLAAAICTATGTVAMIEVEKYLLLGCWAYGETLYEMKILLSGEKIPYVKTKETWCTGLENPGYSKQKKTVKQGMDYGDYLMVLLAKKGQKNKCYARMMDLMEINLQKNDPNFEIKNCTGGFTIQGRTSLNSLFTGAPRREVYEYCFEKEFSY